MADTAAPEPLRVPRLGLKGALLAGGGGPGGGPGARGTGFRARGRSAWRPVCRLADGAKGKRSDAPPLPDEWEQPWLPCTTAFRDGPAPPGALFGRRRPRWSSSRAAQVIPVRNPSRARRPCNRGRSRRSSARAGFARLSGRMGPLVIGIRAARGDDGGRGRGMLGSGSNRPPGRRRPVASCERGRRDASTNRAAACSGPGPEGGGDAGTQVRGSFERRVWRAGRGPDLAAVWAHPGSGGGSGRGGPRCGASASLGAELVPRRLGGGGGSLAGFRTPRPVMGLVVHRAEGPWSTLDDGPRGKGLPPRSSLRLQCRGGVARGVRLRGGIVEGARARRRRRSAPLGVDPAGAGPRRPTLFEARVCRRLRDANCSTRRASSSTLALPAAAGRSPLAGRNA